ncbi:MAG: glycerol-3-phosphate 1-O-acyltransferase PlsY [Candidatus Aminicenantia bacterium]
MKDLIYLLLFFFIGSIPFGWIIYKITEKKDIRKEGSGNIGATNIYRLKGKFYGILVLLLDASKGILTILISKSVFKDPFLWTISALMAVSGHIFSPFLLFKGGKGVATAIGALALISPLVFIISFIPSGVLLFTTRTVSITSLTFSLLYPFIFCYLEKSLFSTAPIFLITFLIYVRHKDNIKRIFKKREIKIKI